MTLSLPDSVYSPDQLQFCVDELQGLANRILSEKRGGAKGSALSLSQSSLDLLATLPTASHGDPAVIDELAAALTERLATAPVVHITLAATAGRGLKQELVQWLRTHCTQSVLVVFRVNPDIAGGMVLRTTNHIYDMSFRHLLLQNPLKFVEVAERVR